MPRYLVCLAFLLILGGCQRDWYRRDADRETYATEQQHTDESAWPVSFTSITPPPASRLFDRFDPDFPPIPPDDPAAHYYMHHPYIYPGSRTYHRDGDALWIEDPTWRDYLETDEDGKVLLSADSAVELGLLHSRDYQTALENLYTAALQLTLDRFAFDMHWQGVNNTVFTQFGSGASEVNTLASNSDLGFSRNLTAGGQLLMDFANSFVFTYSGVNSYTWTSNIAVALVQPLLRNFGRRIALENLTQSERNLLYAVRNFAYFRKQFYVSLTSNGGSLGPGYLSLMLQVQNIRNAEADLKSKQQNYLLHEAQYARGAVSTIQVDQIFQYYEQSKLSLIQARLSLDNALDAYRVTLGLPPDLPTKLDDSKLEPFQLAAPALEKLQDELDRFFAEYRELEQAPELASLRKGYAALGTFQVRLGKLVDEVDAELSRWGQQKPDFEEAAQLKREQATRTALERQMPEFRKDLAKLSKEIASEGAGLTEETRTRDWESLQKQARRLISTADQLYVVQTQVRVYLIKLPPVPYSVDEARELARNNRLDLMNQRAQVVDAWRQIEVTASALKTGLDVHVTANVATAPTSKNPVDFRSSASQYTFGLALDTPLNRMAQRNAYRSSLIAYQASRRAFMALDDQIQLTVRADMRQLELDRANFGINRQILISAAHAVEGTREKLLVQPDPTSTLDLLSALNTLLAAKGSLISAWLSYQSDLAHLLLDTDTLQLDSRGRPYASPDTDQQLDRPRPSSDSEPASAPANTKSGDP
jgi:outer membrane protein TolC